MNILSEIYPESFKKDEFESIRSFQGKLNYAVKHLKRIASGSSRVVFRIDDEKVLKIAKNKKGLAQNKVEGDAYYQNYDITAKVFDKDARNNFWLEMEFAKKLTPRRFKELTGITLDDLWKMLRNGDPHNKFYHDVDTDKYSDNEFFGDLESFINDNNLPRGDFQRISSYGEVVRNGKPTVVAVDYGLTEEVYNDFYRVGPRKSPSIFY